MNRLWKVDVDAHTVDRITLKEAQRLAWPGHGVPSVVEAENHDEATRIAKAWEEKDPRGDTEDMMLDWTLLGGGRAVLVEV